MCIAIYNPNNVTLKKKVLKNCWDNNTDGAGMLYLDGGVLKVHKEMTNFNNFYSFYQDVRRNHSKSHIVLHFRISTHGKINETNCHPFLVNNKLGFVHNGIISNSPYSKDFSDTYMFNEHILQKLPSDFLHNDALTELITEYIGTGSKLIFFDDTNQAYIFNEKAGVWDNGCWFSNTTYKYSGYRDYGGFSVPKSTTYAYDYSYNKAIGKWERALKEDIEDTSSWNTLSSDSYKAECDCCGKITSIKDDYYTMGSYCEKCYNDDIMPYRQKMQDEEDFVF